MLDNKYPPNEVTSGMDGKICIATGVSSGIGKAIAQALAMAGANVVMIARDRSRTEAVLNESRACSSNRAIEMMVADLSSMALVHELVRSFASRHERLHVLVNNAGSARSQLMATSPLSR